MKCSKHLFEIFKKRIVIQAAVIQAEIQTVFWSRDQGREYL